MSKHKTHFHYSFKPLDWVEAHSCERLGARLRDDGSTFEFNGLNAWQARHQWQLEVPLGLFAHDFRPGLITPEQDVAARDALFAKMRPKRFHQARDVIVRDDVTYYRKPVLEQVRGHHDHPELIDALLAFWNAAERDRTIIKPPKPKKPHLEPWERKQRFGTECRGPSWTNEEDDVIRKWFGRRTIGPYAGSHVPLTSDEWNTVLDALGRRRTKAGVHQRLVILNNRLRQEFVDRKYIFGGFIGRAHHGEWLNRVLGERPRPLQVQPSRRRA